MTDTDTPSINPDPFDFGFDPNQVDTTYPIIPAGPYPATITKAEVKIKDDGTKQIHVKYQIDQEVTAESGAIIPAGFHKLSKTYSLSEEALPFVMRLHDAVHGSKKGTRPPLDPSVWEGKQILLNVTTEPERTDPKTGREFPRGNSVGQTSYLRR